MRLKFTMRFIFVEFWTSFLVNNTTTASIEWVVTEDEVVGNKRRKELKDGKLKKSFKSSSLFSCFTLQCFHFSSISFILLYSSILFNRLTWDMKFFNSNSRGEWRGYQQQEIAFVHYCERIVDERERNNTRMSVYTTHLVIFYDPIQ